MATALPSWIKPLRSGAFQLDVDAHYPTLLAELELEESALDHYWLEVLYQFTKLDAQFAVRQAGMDPRPEMSLVFATKGDKERWGRAGKPEGRGAELAAEGKEARGHYLRVRGFLPQ